MNDMPIIIAMYRESDWEEWMNISPSDMCNSWESWKMGVDEAILDATKKGIIIHTAEIRPKEYLEWVKETQNEINGYTRSQFAGRQLKDRFLNSYNPPDEYPKQSEVTKMLRKAKMQNPDLPITGVYDPYLRRPSAGVCPLFRASENSLPDQYGSGVLFQIQDKSFLLSAAHVFDDFKEYAILIPGKEYLTEIFGSYHVSPIPISNSRKDDTTDVGFFTFAPNQADDIDPSLLFLECDDFDPMDTTEEGDAYTIIGYQASLSKSSHGISSGEISRISCSGVSDYRFKKLGLSPEKHILLQYRMKKGISYETMIQGKKHDFQGMSGGGVFAWSKELPDTRKLTQPKLCGIVTGYESHYNVFVVTRIHCVLSAIHKAHPHLPLFPT